MEANDPVSLDDSRSTVTLVLLIAAAGWCCRLACWPQSGPRVRRARFPHANSRLDGRRRRAGEGYWSTDGRASCSRASGNRAIPFYQIYLMDMASGDVTRVSPGMGKTTCSFINPETGDVLFASTHHDPRSKQLQDEELKFRASGQERRYSWDYDPEMELYVRSAKTGHAAPPDEQARLRRRGELLARRPVDRVLVDARRLRSHALGGGTEAARDSIPATSARSTSCAPTPTAPGDAL